MTKLMRLPPPDHEGEKIEERLARRAANWTPAKLRR